MNRRSSIFTTASSPFVEDPRTPFTPRRNTAAASAEQISDLEDKIKNLQFELETEVTERNRDKLVYENKIRELEEEANRQSQRAELLESEKFLSLNQRKEAIESLKAARSEAKAEKSALDEALKKTKRQLSETQARAEEIEDSSTAKIDSLSRRANELKDRNMSLESALAGLRGEFDTTVADLIEKRTQVAELQEEVAKLKGTESKDVPGSSQEIEFLQRELSNQMKLVTKHEDTILDLESSIAKLNDSKRLVEVLEEEKKSLELRANSVDELNQQISNLELEILKLKDSDRKWRNFLESSDEFDSPEDVVRELINQRVEIVGLLNKIGELEAKIGELSGSSSFFEDQIAALRAELKDSQEIVEKEKAHSARLQQQRDLAMKETDMLREHLKAFDKEESIMAGEKVDETKTKRIEELEQIIDGYKSQSLAISRSLDEKEGMVQFLNSPKRKLAATEHNDERLTEALRKNKNLQAELSSCQNAITKMTKDIEAYKKTIKDLEESSQERARILELRGNPTAKYQAIKQSQLTALRKENEELLAQIAANPQVHHSLVPSSALDSVREQMRQLETDLRDASKRIDRLKEVFGKKSLEFREIVYSLLGYRIDLLPNKKVRATSVFAQNEEESFIFIPDPKHKNRFIGLEPGALSHEFENIEKFWINERNEIKCFLAAVNLEFYDRTTKAGRF